MKIIISMTVICLNFFFINIKSGEIKILVSNIKEEKGTIHYGIYNNSDLFPKKQGRIYGGYQNVSDVLRDGILINELEESVFAIAIYHDQNENGKFDTFFGIPEEKYGFSNDAAVFFGPPSFNEASFNLDESESKIMEIRLR